MAAYLLTLRIEDIWDAPDACKEHLEAVEEKMDVRMEPSDLCPAMFEQLYPQDAKKITEKTSNINAMARIIAAYTSRLYYSELDDDVVMTYLCPQPKEIFHYWYNTPGILHEQFQQGLGRSTFDPPVYFDTKEYVDPPRRSRPSW